MHYNKQAGIAVIRLSTPENVQKRLKGVGLDFLNTINLKFNNLAVAFKMPELKRVSF